MTKSPIFPGAVAGQHQSGLRRALRLAALVPVIAGGLALGTANFAQADPEPVIDEPTTTTTEAPTTTTTEAPTTTTTAPPVVPVFEVVPPILDAVLPGDGAINVSWIAPELDEGDVVFLYQVIVKEGDVIKGVRILSGDTHQATVAGLTNESDYTVLVRSITSGGIFDSLVSSIVEPTADAVEAVLAEVEATVTQNAYSATATWAAPASDGGSPIVAYVVNAVDNSTGKLVAWRTVGADVRSASIAPLAKGIEYTISVFAVTGKGFGEASSHDLIGSITGDAPEAPAAPTASAYVPETGNVIASWLPAAEQGVPVVNYNVVLIQDGKMVGWSVYGADARSGSVAGYDRTKDADTDVYVFAASVIGYGELTKVTVDTASAPEA
jgi:hypothetical protein